jgi:DNA-binding CsgD family transcriptional regulator
MFYKNIVDSFPPSVATLLPQKCGLKKFSPEVSALFPILAGTSVSLFPLSTVYGITAALALALLVGCVFLNKKKDPWLFLLFVCVLVVNVGYFLLSSSRNLTQALNANRLSYFGSVFLPLSMLMMVLRLTRISYASWLPKLLLGFGIAIFLITASPGILDIYYEKVAFRRIENTVSLEKVYGPLHSCYLIYLLGYFSVIVGVIVYASRKNKIVSVACAAILAAAVFVNIAVWLVEQFVNNRFEFLSVSYIISELFLLGLHMFMSEVEKNKAPAIILAPAAVSSEEKQLFTQGLALLTAKEKAVYDCYVAGLSTEQVLEKLSIKENTLKFHNKNLYSKLGVSSRKQLLTVYKYLEE